MLFSAEELTGPRLLPLTVQFIQCAKVSGKRMRVEKSSCSLLAKPCALWSGRREVSFWNSCTHRAHFIVGYWNASGLAAGPRQYLPMDTSNTYSQLLAPSLTPSLQD